MAAHLEASGPELLMDAWCAVEAAVPFKHGLELGRDGCVLLGPWPLSGDSENWSRCELINTRFSSPGGTGANPTGCIAAPGGSPHAKRGLPFLASMSHSTKVAHTDFGGSCGALHHCPSCF